MARETSIRRPSVALNRFAARLEAAIVRAPQSERPVPTGWIVAIVSLDIVWTLAFNAVLQPWPALALISPAFALCAMAWLGLRPRHLGLGFARLAPRELAIIVLVGTVSLIDAGRQGRLTPALLSDPAWVLDVAFYAAFEEVIFRGLLLSHLDTWFGRRHRPLVASLAALTISATIFAVPHVSAPHGDFALVAGTFLFGLLAGALVVLTGSLWLPIVVHVVHNLIALSCGDQPPHAFVVQTAAIGLLGVALLRAATGHVRRR